MVWVAIFALVLIGIVGFSVDWGKVSLNAHQLHNAADAAALAGALIVKTRPADAIALAAAAAGHNDAEQLPVLLRTTIQPEPFDGNEDVLDIVLGRWIRQERMFLPTLSAPSAVKAIARRADGAGTEAPPVSLAFGPAFDTDTVNVTRHAIAWSRGSTRPGIIQPTPNPSIYRGWNRATGMLVAPGAVIDLRGPDGIVGDIQINSGSEIAPWLAFRLDGLPVKIYAGELNVAGTTYPDADDAATWETCYADPIYPFSVNPGSPAIPDPLAGIEAPNIDAMDIPRDRLGNRYTYTINDTVVAGLGVVEADPVTGLPTGRKVLTLTPGYYPGGIDIGSSASKIVLTGGSDAVYAFGGGTAGRRTGLYIQGGMLVGIGVMCYVSGDLDGSHPLTGVIYYGQINIGGSAVIRISSRGDTDELPSGSAEAGIALWQDRDNSSYSRIIVTGSCEIAGTIYCGYNPLEIGGAAEQMGNQLIAGALSIRSNTSLGIAYDGRNAIESFRSILVE